MDEIFEKTIGNEFSDLKGLTVDASIPVRQHIINELIEFRRGADEFGGALDCKGFYSPASGLVFHPSQ
jgi:hypothetical protein